MQYFVKTFNNLDQFSEYLNTSENNPIFGKYLESETGTRTFTGTENFAEADTLMQFGDPEKAKKIKNISAPGTVKTNAKDIKPRRERSVYGGSVNVAAALSGRPKAMYKIFRTPVKSKVLNIAYNVSVPWTVSAGSIAEVAARLVSAICAIEKKGYRVNLYACKVSKESGEVFGCFVKIKDSGKHMDRTKMAYPLINPSMLRRHMFRALEKTPGLCNAWKYGYGHHADTETSFQAARRAGIDLHTVASYSTICNLSEGQMIDYLVK